MSDNASPRPNIVMILTDDHGSQSISTYGSRINTTPRIDEIANSGVRFDNCFVTNSLCSPSRASILTGTYSHINGVTTLKTPIDSSQPTFISQLKAAGYKTAIVGKWHMGHGEGHNPEDFDYWDIFTGSGGQGEYWNPVMLSADGQRTEEGYATEIVTDLALNWLESVEEEGPWCILIYHKAPHRSWEPHPRYQDAHKERLELPHTFNDDYATRSASTRRVAMRVADHLSTDDLKEDPPEGLTYDELAAWKYQRFMEDYLACVDSVDESVGQVIDWLKSHELFDNTLTMYGSDQGFFLGDHGWFDKRLMYEESLRMPLVLSYPSKVKGGQEFDGLISNVDWAQSILDAAGVAHHPRMQGRSFWGDITGEPETPPATGIYYRYWENDDLIHKAPAHYGYRTERYKLIYFYNDGLGLPGTSIFSFPPEWELYDLKRDPDELTNVYDDPEYADIREDLKREMWVEQRRLEDTPHPSQTPPLNTP